MRFELRQLENFGDESLLAELRRVAAENPTGRLTRDAFDRHSKAASVTIVRRFGGWQAALERAGLGQRYSGRVVSSRMRNQEHRGALVAEIIAEVQRVARLAGDRGLTRAFFDQNASFHSTVLTRRFGSWGAGLRRAGIEVVAHGRRHRDEDYYENLLTVWTHYGRQPVHREMDNPPSRITAGAYDKKFGSWRRALAAFVDRINAASDEAPVSNGNAQAVASGEDRLVPAVASQAPARVQKLSLGLRYEILRRDRFRCVMCGRSPAATPGIELHVDHIVHRARGGSNQASNLRSLCNQCNLGRGTKHDEAQ